MNTCAECGSSRVKLEVLESYETEIGGLMVTLADAVIRELCEDCREATIEIPDLEGLAMAVAMARALVPWRLHGRDVRLMRMALGMSGREFAAAMRMQPETISRWENGQALGGYADSLLRHNVCALLHRKMPSLDYDPADIVAMDIQDTAADQVPPMPVFRRVIVKHDRQHANVWDMLPEAA